MIYLGDKTAGRDNNLNLIRAIAASAVLVSHAFPIALGPGATQPMEQLFGHTLGTISVFAFFSISGFLIASSFERSSSKTSFLTARFLRLYPALICSLLLVAFLIAPLVSSLSASDFLGSSAPWLFMVKNTLLASPMFVLPSVFETNPYTAIEGSIWTLFYEVLCYMGVFVAGVAGVLRNRLLASVALLIYFALWLGIEASGLQLHPKLHSLLNLSLPFVVGTLFYLWQDRLPLHLAGFAALGALTWLAHGSFAYTVLFCVTLAYGVFWLAYIPGGFLKAYNRLGDYSYGIYIYAFPLQGLAVYLFGPQTPWQNMLYAYPATLMLSVLSWHLIEDPALRMKSRVVGWMKPA